jgi:hypothetical protein
MGNNMVYTKKIKDAIKLAIKTHEVDQKQKRKGKDVPYIIHPLTVGLILSLAGAVEDTIVAGILHDTIEDSIPGNKVTKDVLEKQFGKDVSELVCSVTESDKNISWDIRKKEALDHVRTFSHKSILLKSADIISNSTELIEDYQKDGESVWRRFNAPKEKLLENLHLLIVTILRRWPENPLAKDLESIIEHLPTEIPYKKNLDKKYTVKVDDNYHYMDESAGYIDGYYSTQNEAIKRCEEITMQSLR